MINKLIARMIIKPVIVVNIGGFSESSVRVVAVPLNVGVVVSCCVVFVGVELGCGVEVLFSTFGVVFSMNYKTIMIVNN